MPERIGVLSKQKTIYLENTFRPAKNDLGQVIGALVLSRDITESKIAEKVLKEIEERWRFALEGGKQALAFSSGLGAVTTVMHLLSPGDRVVLIADVYGGVYRMTSQVYEPKGYLFDYVPAWMYAYGAAGMADLLDRAEDPAETLDRGLEDPVAVVVECIAFGVENLVGDLGHHAEVVCNEQDRHPGLGLHPFQ